MGSPWAPPKLNVESYERFSKEEMCLWKNEKTCCTSTMTFPNITASLWAYNRALTFPDGGLTKEDLFRGRRGAQAQPPGSIMSGII